MILQIQFVGPPFMTSTNVWEYLTPSNPSSISSPNECVERFSELKPCSRNLLPLSSLQQSTERFIWSDSWVGLALILAVPLSAWICCGWWGIGRTGQASGQDDGITKIKIIPIQLSNQMGHPVFDTKCMMSKLVNSNVG